MSSPNKLSKPSGIGSHQSKGVIHAEGSKNIYVFATWMITNESPSPLEMDYRVRLMWAKGGNDQNWFEYNPQEGIKNDIFRNRTGTPVVTLHGASVESPRTKQIMQGRQQHTFSMGFVLPGPGRSVALASFWRDQEYYDFNFLVAPHEIKDGKIRKIGEHEFTNFARVYA